LNEDEHASDGVDRRVASDRRWGGRVAGAQSWQPPADSQRCPSKWGAADQRGAGNLITPASVLKALQADPQPAK